MYKENNLPFYKRKIVYFLTIIDISSSMVYNMKNEIVYNFMWITFGRINIDGIFTSRGTSTP